MPKYLTQTEAIRKCQQEGRFLVLEELDLEKIKSDNHQCLFAYLCHHHPELELNWDFLEKIRTKRNGINYYGMPISFKDWKEIELQLKLYIKKLKEEIQKGIESYT